MRARSLATVLILTAGIFVVGSAPFAARAAHGTIARVSITGASTEANGSSIGADIAEDTGEVVFSSYATNLAGTDANGTRDVFLRTASNTTILISRTTGGNVAGDGASDSPSISSTGRYIAFRSAATNLVASDTNAVSDIFLYDRDGNGNLIFDDSTPVVTLVSRSTGGALGNGASDQPSVSADGRWVGFRSFASNLDAMDTNDVADIYLRDVTTPATHRASTDANGIEGNGASSQPSVASDANYVYVAFTSDADNLVSPDDDNLVTDVFRWRRAIATGALTVAIASKTTADGRSIDPSISANGARVAFTSGATNLIFGDTNARTDVFLRDFGSNVLERISVGQPEGNSHSDQPAISGNGSLVAFRSFASNLISGDTNGMRDVFVRNLTLSTTSRSSLNAADSQVTGRSYEPAITNVGQVAFHYDASDLASSDTNGVVDVFVRAHDVLAPALPTVSVTDGHSSSTWSTDTTIVATIGGSDTPGGYVTGVDGYGYRWSTTADHTPSAFKDIDETASSITSHPLGSGAWYLHIRAVDNAGNWGPTRHAGPFKIDVTNPEARLVKPEYSTDMSKSLTIALQWSGTDPHSGIKNYDVYYKRAKYNRSTNDYETTVKWKSATTDTSANFPASAGYTYIFWVKARDNVSRTDESSKGKMAVPTDDTSLTRSSGWTTETNSAYFGGEASRSTTYGSTLKMSARYVGSGGVLAPGYGFIATRCSSCGKVRIIVDGEQTDEINLYSSTTQRTWLKFIYGPENSSASITLKVTSPNGKVVLIEALGAIRYGW